MDILIFTDGSFYQIKEAETAIFGISAADSGESRGSSAVIVYSKSKDTNMFHLREMLLVPDLTHTNVLFLTPYYSEAIGIICALKQIRTQQLYGIHKYTIYSDCKSLVSEIKSTAECYNHILNRDPYLAVIHKLSRGLDITFLWVRSHIERREKDHLKWDFPSTGNYLADRVADRDWASLKNIGITDKAIRDIIICPFTSLIVELQQSARFVFVHNGIPVSEGQMVKLHHLQRAQRYLRKRVTVST